MSEDIRVLGLDTHIKRSNTPLALGVIGAGILGLILLRSRGHQQQSMPVPSFSVPASDIEFARITSQAMDQLNQLNAANAIEQRKIDAQYQLQAGLTPGLLRQCIPFEQWYNLDGGTRSSITQQVRDGKMLQSVTLNGLCFTPTNIGVRGSEPPLTETSKRGYFSSSNTITGPAGSFQAVPLQPGNSTLQGLFDALVQLYADYSGATSMVPGPPRMRKPPSGPIDPGIYVPQGSSDQYHQASVIWSNDPSWPIWPPPRKYG